MFSEVTFSNISVEKIGSYICKINTKIDDFGILKLVPVKTDTRR